VKPKTSLHYETRYTLTLAGFLATEAARREHGCSTVGPLRSRSPHRTSGIPYKITDAGRAALASEDTAAAAH